MGDTTSLGRATEPGTRGCGRAGTLSAGSGVDPGDSDSSDEVDEGDEGVHDRRARARDGGLGMNEVVSSHSRHFVDS